MTFDFDRLDVFQGVLAGITMTGSLPYNFPANMTPNMGARDISSLGWFQDGLAGSEQSSLFIRQYLSDN